VYTATLDISTAHDCVQHFNLFCAGMPRNFVYLPADWYSSLFIVKWNDAFSAPFDVGSGVRQGSSLSRVNVFINKVIMDLKRLDKTWIGSVLYADDIMLLSAALSSLQTMENRVCSMVICELNFIITVLN